MLAILRRSVAVIVVTTCFFGTFTISLEAQGAEAGETKPASTTPAGTAMPRGESGSPPSASATQPSETASSAANESPAGTAPATTAPATTAPATTGSPSATESSGASGGDAPADVTNGANQAPPGSSGQKSDTAPGELPAGFKMLEVPRSNTAPKAPPSSGKPQIGIQMPAYKQLAWFLRINEPASVARIKSAEARMRVHLTKAGMDPNITIDDAMELGKPVINIYLKKSHGDNILAHGFCLQAYLMQYVKLPSGRINTARCARIGESPEVYSGADFEDKAVMLVDAYISARHHQLREAAAKKKPAATKGKKKK